LASVDIVYKVKYDKNLSDSIILPEYKTKEEMKKVIKIIIENDTNYFGLE